MKYLSFSFILLVFLISCGGSSSPGNGNCCTVPGINVEVVSPAGPAAIDDNPSLTLPITVQVTNDSSNAGVTWTVGPAVKGGPTGTLSNQQPLSVTYTPPTGVTSSIQVSITATSVTDSTRSVAIPVNIYPPLTTTTTSSNLAAAFLNTNYTCIQQPIGSSGVVQIPCSVAVTGGLAPYTWSLGNTFLPIGLQLAPGISTTTEIVGTPTATGVYPFSLTATDATGNATTVALTINVAPSQLKVTTPTIMTLIPGVPYVPVQLQASGGVPPYTWSLAGGSLPVDPQSGKPAMSLSSSGAISGTPPANVTQGQFAVRVQDSQSPVPAQAVFPPPSPAGTPAIALAVGDPEVGCNVTTGSVQANTPYAFVFTGFDVNGPVTFSGSFTADANGNLAGVEDIIRSNGAQLAQPLTAGSSIFVDNFKRGCLTLNTSASSSFFRFAITTQTTSIVDARIVEFDDTNGFGTRGTGYFRIQDSTAFATPLAGPFAFRFSGWDASANHFAMAGTATAQTGSLTAVSTDVNDGGTFSGPLTGGGTISAADANGRGAATLSAGAASYDLVYYIVDANHLIFNSSQVVSHGHPLITGEATASAGPFSPATLDNSHIYRFGGAAPGSPDVGVGVLHFDGAGAAGGTTYEKSGGTASATTVSAQYSVDSTSGRFTFSGTGVPVVGYAVPSPGGVTAYLVGTSASAASGTMEFQTNSYPPGYQSTPIDTEVGLATEEMLDPQSTVFAGVEDPTVNGGLNGTPTLSYLDSSNLTGLFPFQEFTLFKFTWNPDGSGTWGGSTYMVTSESKFFYIDTSPLNAHPAVVVGQKQQ
ncbi:MAG: putative Ig domain-containing protein [Acidobacteriia bacterium]|nr:putative Ig domain-containing protein [Terriglobia bacterium]